MFFFPHTYMMVVGQLLHYYNNSDHTGRQRINADPTAEADYLAREKENKKVKYIGNHMGIHSFL